LGGRLKTKKSFPADLPWKKRAKKANKWLEPCVIWPESMDDGIGGKGAVLEKLILCARLS